MGPSEERLGLSHARHSQLQPPQRWENGFMKGQNPAWAPKFFHLLPPSCQGAAQK